MKYGLALPQARGFDVRHDVTTIAAGAERAGYASVWVYERVLYPLNPADGMNGVPGLAWLDFYQECADPLTVLTLAATATDRVALGTGILVAPLHQPLRLARALATIDRASGGRVVAGLGSGWSSDEYRAMGARFARRGQALETTVDACRTFWGDNPVSYQDDNWQVGESLVNPKPAHPIPILLGGGRTERALNRIGRIADGWLPTGLPPAAVAAGWQRIRDVADENGRDAAALRLVPRAGVFLSGAPAPADRRPFQGTLEQVVEDAATLVKIGADEIVLDLFPSARDGAELLDRALAVLDALTSAGL